MTLTDKIIFFSAIFLFWRGWSKGFAQTILGPLALIVGSLLSYVYYILSNNFLAAIAVGIVAPILLNIIFTMTIGALFFSKDKGHISLLSRLSGGLLNMGWGEFFVVAGMVLILMIPVDLPTIKKAQTDIQTSGIYTWLKPVLNQWLGDDVSSRFDPSKLASLSDPAVLQSIEKSKEYTDLMSDERVQALVNDPSIAKEIEDKNISKLMQNPKFLALTRDPALLKKFLALYSTMIQKASAKTAGTAAGPASGEPSLKEEQKQPLSDR